MRKDVVVDVSAADRARLETVAANRNSPQKHVWRARIVLLTADGLGTVEIMRRTGKSKTCVWRWQDRFMAAGVDGLLRDKTRPSRVPPLPAEVVERVIAPGATHLAKPPTGPGRRWPKRSAICRQTGRHCRALFRSAGPCHCLVGR